MLNPSQRAQLGVGLIQEAIVEFLSTNGNSASQTDIQNNLGLGGSLGEGSTGVLASILTDLSVQNIVQRQGDGKQATIRLLGTGTGASRGATANR